MKIEKLIVFLVPSLVLLNYLGRGLYNSTLAIISLFIVILFIKEKELFKNVINEKIFIYFSIFLIFISLTIPFSINLSYSFSKFSTFIFSSYVTLFSSIYLYKISQNKKKNFFFAIYILFITTIIMESITIFNITNHMDILLYIKENIIRPQSNNYHLREIFTSAIMPLNLLLYYYKPTKIKGLFIIISFIGILASTSRTAILATLISITIYILIKNRFKLFNKDILLFSFAILFASSISFYISPEIKQRVESFQTTFTSKGDMMSGRYQVYQKAYEIFLQSPIVGNGIKSANYLSQSNKFIEIAKHPHNIWLEILMDTGVIGLFGFLIFIFFLLHSAFTATSNSYIIKATIWATLSSIFLSSLSSWSIWSGNHIGSIIVILILVYSLKDNKK